MPGGTCPERGPETSKCPVLAVKPLKINSGGRGFPPPQLHYPCVFGQFASIFNFNHSTSYEDLIFRLKAGLVKFQLKMDEEMDFSQTIATPELTQTRQTNLASSATVNDTNTNTITNNTNVGTVVARIEGILEQIIDALAAGQELSIGFSPRRAVRQAANASPEQVHFPGRNKQEAIKFGNILRHLHVT